ncbi:hypothetical protein LSAT2_020913 [Lamellibrachia satsuma]|nr:hypothetical protein LSAT2_020913 [Lamellibrachia satsuma]
MRAASPVLLRIVLLGAFLLYCPMIVQYFEPSPFTCSITIWMRELGFSISYGALLLKTWRISVVFRVRSAQRIKISDTDLMKRLALIVLIFGAYLTVRTVIGRPRLVEGIHSNGLRTVQCSWDVWDYCAAIAELGLLLWGIRLCIVVRKAPSEFNESRFISWAIYNETLLSLFLNITMFFLQSPANPDLLYLVRFIHTQLTTTVTLTFLFGSKAHLERLRPREEETKETTTVADARPERASLMDTNPGETSAKETGMEGDRRKGMGGDRRMGMGGDRRKGMGGDRRKGKGGDQRTGMGGDRRTGMGGDRRTGMGGDRRTGMGGDRRTGMGGDRRTGMGGDNERGWEVIDERGWEVIDERGWEVIDERGWEVIDERGWEVIDERGWEVINERGWEVIDERGWEVIDERGWEVIDERVWEVIDERGWEVIDERGWEVINERGWEVIDERGWQVIDERGWQVIDDSE